MLGLGQFRLHDQFDAGQALAARYQDEDFWRRSMQEGDEEGPEQ
jgi:hypothetical protein